MYRGLLLDNVSGSVRVPDSSIEKLRAMRATAVGTLWTRGTQHWREVYLRCEQALVEPFYLIRVGGHKQTAAEWLADADRALAEVPYGARGRCALVFGNEPNHPVEGWEHDPAGYGATFAEVARWLTRLVLGGVAGELGLEPVARWTVDLELPMPPVLFACPSLGLPMWRAYLASALRAASAAGVEPRGLCANLYAGDAQLAGELVKFGMELYLGELNAPIGLEGENRAKWLSFEFRHMEGVGVKAAVVFIAGGDCLPGEWDKRYILTQAEAEALGELMASDDLERALDEPLTDAERTMIGLEVADVAPAAEVEEPAGPVDPYNEVPDPYELPDEEGAAMEIDEQVKASPAGDLRKVLSWAHVFGPLAASSPVRVSLLAGLIYQESGGNERAESAMNHVDGRPIGRAQGLCQVLPGHFGFKVGEDGELDPQSGRYVRQPRRNVAQAVSLLERLWALWAREDSMLAGYFGAVDKDGEPTTETDGSGTPGTRYVELVLGWAKHFRALDGIAWSELGEAAGPDDLDLGQCAYGESWPEVVANLFGVASDALDAGRAVVAGVNEAAGLWGGR